MDQLVFYGVGGDDKPEGEEEGEEGEEGVGEGEEEGEEPEEGYVSLESSLNIMTYGSVVGVAKTAANQSINCGDRRAKRAHRESDSAYLLNGDEEEEEEEEEVLFAAAAEEGIDPSDEVRIKERAF